MEAISVFDMFKVGVGPSSSHTLGPWKASREFFREMAGLPVLVAKVEVHLFGSLALTGKGHGTDRAITMGLLDKDPETVSLDFVRTATIDTIRIDFGKGRSIPFSASKNIRYFKGKRLPFHANGMKFQALDEAGELILDETYYSIGGGFIIRENHEPQHRAVPAYYVDSAEQLALKCQQKGFSISQLVEINERAWYSQDEIDRGLERIWNCMLESVYNGCHQTGTLPGGLQVNRRAARMIAKLQPGKSDESQTSWLESIMNEKAEFQDILSWVGGFALAVNEENASFGRVVTAPTNGAAGVIPSVLLYYLCFDARKMDREKINAFLLTASEIGSLFKRNATISAAMGGCQAEIGVSSAMAAAGLTEVQGGSVDQCLMAAEIAMEHHLGLTCDPVGGLVQIPCIERNSMGAVKAITAARIAIASEPKNARVSLDHVIRTMWDTARDMKVKYKETSRGGLAVNISVKVPEC